MICNPDRSIRALLGAGGLAIVAAALASLAGALPARADAGDARTTLAQALGQFQRGHWTAARDRALAATQADPDWGFAQTILARTQLALGDGAAAEGSLDRATKAGFDPRRSHQLRAHARLLQGDAAGAMAEADRTAPRYRGYATTIRAQALAMTGDVKAGLATLETRVAQAPRDAMAWIALGRMRWRAGDMVGAINASTAAVQADAASPDALRLRAEAVRAQYGLVAALPWYESVLARDPYAHDTLIDYAATLGDAGRARAMLAAVRRAMAVRPGSAQGLYLQAVLAARAGDTATARSVLDKAGRGLAGVPGALLLSGSIALADGQAAQAAIPLRELVARQPTSITARKLLALALLQSDSAREAFDTILPVAARGDADSYTLLLAGRALERIGDRANAAPLFDRAAALARGRSTAFATGENLATLANDAAAAPGSPVATLPYIRALAATGDAAGALAAAQALADANPGSPAARLVLGDALAGAGQMADAATAYARAATSRFDEATMLRLVDARDRAGQRGAASATLSLFLTQNPGNVAALRLLGAWQVAAGEHDAAIETLESLRERVGDRDVTVLAMLARAYAGADRADAAQGYAGAAYALAPSNPMTADALGWVLYAGDNIGAAVPLAVKAVRLAPGDATIRWHMAQIADAAGNRAVAIANARAALADPRFAERAAAQALIAGS
ncbi:tetratricopeptide repeat protein [Sphingomonas sp. 2R-10]|uniref:tetratricopeptide repeat protein n=1 Tax=Sphingomonas sp. 2R-10 TaxID=3045148 RepID=UPI000F76DF24|nr:tetratricopeptide repeat protein [Sphingomonas sp. 2R-10]MDJ0278294.1 tetratricopeptide repeat protein [Sphingomonas sp. 2R-10]